MRGGQDKCARRSTRPHVQDGHDKRARELLQRSNSSHMPPFCEPCTTSTHRTHTCTSTHAHTQAHMRFGAQAHTRTRTRHEGTPPRGTTSPHKHPRLSTTHEHAATHLLAHALHLERLLLPLLPHKGQLCLQRLHTPKHIFLQGINVRLYCLSRCQPLLQGLQSAGGIYGPALCCQARVLAY